MNQKLEKAMILLCQFNAFTIDGKALGLALIKLYNEEFLEVWREKTKWEK